MKLLIIATSALVILSSCTFGNKEVSVPTSPYPQIPLGATGAATPALPPTTSAMSFKATGTEPFWSAEINATSTILSRPGEKGVETKTFVTSQTDKGAIITIKDAKGEFFVNLLKGECKDGMSETKYSYSATVLIGADTLNGCANLVK